MKRTAVYTGTRNVYGYMVTACKSLLYHKGADRVVFMIEDDTFPEELPSMVHTINVINQQYFDRNGPNYNKHWTYMVLMKVAVPMMLYGCRVLTLDVDTIVNGNLDGLWSLPKAPVYMAREIGRPGEYYNAGVMLIDTDLFIDDAKRIINLLNTKDYQFCEQDAINDRMHGRIKQLPAEFNVSNWTVPPTGKPIIYHYAAVRQWQHEPMWQRYEQMTWAEAINGSGEPPR